MDQPDELDKLIARWKCIQHNRSTVPPVAGLVFLAAVLPMFFTVCGGGDPAQDYLASLIFYFALLLIGFLGIASLRWRFECNHLLTAMLQHDDLRLVPIFIQALPSRYLKYFAPVSKRLIQYLDRMTLDDSALLTEREYTQLHHYLFYHPAHHFEDTHGYLQIAILRAIEKMGHAPSLSTARVVVSRSISNSKLQTEVHTAAKQCLATLLEIQEKAKLDSTLLRPSQQEATPETLLRPAMSTNASADNLLKPANAPDEENRDARIQASRRIGHPDRQLEQSPP